MTMDHAMLEVAGLILLAMALVATIALITRMRRMEKTIQAQLAGAVQGTLSECWEKLLRENRDHGERLGEKFYSLDKTVATMASENLLKLRGTFEQHHTSLLKENSQSMEKLFHGLRSFEQNFSAQQTKNFEQLDGKVENKLNEISRKVKESLDDGLKRTNQTFTQVMERISKIDEAQKKIEQLSSDVVSLQDVLTDKKSRGLFGEVQLGHLLATIFGEKNHRIYRLQYKLGNQKIVDAILFLPTPLGHICVDSKFPLENYQRMYDKTLAEPQRHQARKEFKQNVKRHITDIAEKYIIEGETANQAIMFLPAEAIFAEINAYHHDLLHYAQKHRVWMTSPTTLMASLSSIQVILRDIERSKYAHVIQEQLSKLSEDFGRYRKRWDNLAVHIETVSKDVREIHTTTDKISTQFNQIKDVQLSTNNDHHPEKSLP